MTMPIKIAMDEIVMRVNNFLHQFAPAAQDEFDGIKLLERKVLERVEASSLLTSEGKLELALKEAEEATRVLSSLKTTVLRNQQQRLSSRPNSSLSSNVNTDKRMTTSAGQTDTRQPMTTGVNLFDLSIMVKCNLAARLRNNGQLEGSLELYTQLCKMAIDQVAGGNSSNSFISEPNSNQQQPQQYKYLLHRFGLNIGNILFEMKEYQRALKYYRLTLDRLSSLAGCRNLQIKLMNNITIALMAMNGILSNGDEQTSSTLTEVQSKGNRTGAFGGLSKTNDHITSIQLLLNDNSYETAAKQQQAPLKPPNEMKNYSARQVLNSNHHRFGLNLVVCQYEKSDLASIYSTLKSLVQVDGCGDQYKRVLNFSKMICHDENEEHGHDGRPISHNKSTLSEINKLLLDELLVQTQTAHTLNGTLSSDARKGRIGTPELGAAGGKLSDHSMVGTLRNATTNGATSSSDQPLRQVTTSARNDELESLICAKELEIHKALTRSCILVIDLDRSRTSALSKCSKLVATSDLYRALREDLWVDRVSRLLLATRANSLSNGLYVLERIGSNQQVGAAVVVGSPAASVDSSASKSHRLTQTTSRLGSSSKRSPPQSLTVHCKSPLVATNLGLLYLLRKRYDTALRMNARAISLGRSSVESFVNMANCQIELNEGQLAERIYALALRLRPNCWVAYFNSLLVSVKLGHHPDDIRDLLGKISKVLKTDRASHRQASSRFAKVKTALTQLTLMALYKQSGMMQRFSSSLDELLAAGPGPELSPEICLLASKLPSTNELTSSKGPDNAAQKPITILQQTLRLHPYHIPTAERLIAFYISEFNYTNAIQILADCIKNRPDQVKWYQMLAECHRRGANYNESIRIYKHVMDIFPISESCVKALAKLADELGLEEERLACKTRLEQLSKARNEL